MSEVQDRMIGVEDAPTAERRRLPQALTIVLWLVIGALAVILLMRFIAWDALQPFALLDSLTLVIFLPALPIAIIAAVGRRFALAIAASVVMLLQIAIVYPEFAAAQAVPGWAAHAPTFRLLDANVYYDNPSMAGYAAQIRHVHPDVLTMEESRPSDVAQLKAAGALDGLPYQFEVYGFDPFIFFIASRYPLTGTRVLRLGEHPLMVETTLRLPSGPQTMWVLHTIAPLPISFDQWKRQIAFVDQQVRSRGTAGLLLLGDFNSTWGNQGFRDILASGLADAAAARGEPLAMTWSQLMSPLPPLVRVDHVLTGPNLTAAQITTIPGPGSDHRALVATIAVRQVHSA
jgi:endonuclease/exonuclease/phosphatase (EEP) superfamily protein YafD